VQISRKTCCWYGWQISLFVIISELLYVAQNLQTILSAASNSYILIGFVELTHVLAIEMILVSLKSRLFLEMFWQKLKTVRLSNLQIGQTVVFKGSKD